MGQQERYSTLNSAPRAIVVALPSGRYVVATPHIACQAGDTGDAVVIYALRSKQQPRGTAIRAARSLLRSPAIAVTANGEEDE